MGAWQVDGSTAEDTQRLFGQTEPSSPMPSRGDESGVPLLLRQFLFLGPRNQVMQSFVLAPFSDVCRNGFGLQRHDSKAPAPGISDVVLEPYNASDT